MDIAKSVILAIILPYVLVILVASLRILLTREIVPVKEGKVFPDAVIIPFFNEEFRIYSLLNSLKKANLPPSTAVIFINDFSSDNTEKIINQWNMWGGCAWKIIHNSTSKGKRGAIITSYLAFNLFNKKVLMVDADVWFESRAIEKMAIFSTVTGASHVLQPVLVAPYDSSLLVKAQFIESAGVFLWNVFLDMLRLPLIMQGAFFQTALSQEILYKLSKIEYPAGDDMFIQKFIREDGDTVRMCIEPVCMVFTAPVKSFYQFFEQRKRWLGKITPFSFPFHFFLACYVFVVNLIFLAGILFFPIPSLCIAIAEWTGAVVVISKFKLFHRLVLIISFLPARIIYGLLLLMMPLETIIRKCTRQK